MHLTRLAMLGSVSILAMSGIAFAKSGGAGSGAPAPVLPPSGEPATAPAPVLPLSGEPATAPAPVAAAPVATPKRAAPELTEIAEVFAKPAKSEAKSNRGGKAQYPFESLTVGQSFGVLNKSFKNVNSTVASCNKRQPKVPVHNADGTPKMVTVDVPGQGKASVPAIGPAKVFSALTVPAGNYGDKDWPEHVRVWRDA